MFTNRRNFRVMQENGVDRRGTRQSRQISDRK